MPSLLDLFRLNNQALSYNDVTEPNKVPARLQNLPPPPPKEPEWDIRSGLPEPGLGQVTPEEWLPVGTGAKLAALAGKGAVLMGAIKSARKSGLSYNPEERALAFLTAQRNAAIPVSEGGLGLRPDNTAAERAAAMGFKGEGYHYSQAEDEVTHLDPLNHPLGMKAAIEHYGSVPADFIGTHVGSKQAALERALAFNGEDVIDPIGATYPVLFKNNAPYKSSGLLMTDKQFSAIPEEVYGLSKYNPLPRTKILEMRGELFKDSSNIPYYNEYEHYGSMSHVLPPENIRSRFAAFDPAKRGDPDLLGHVDPRLLGAIAGGTVGGITLNRLLQLNGAQR